jgi:uncharacterized protein YfcZ (UPF0381/DUF406 family)
MARKTGGVLALATLLLVLGMSVMGCGPKPPCEGVYVTEVQAAQDQADAATAELEAVRAERADLEAGVAATRSEIAGLESQPAALEARLNELKKGSGR